MTTGMNMFALLDRLDAYGTEEPGFHEGFPEDRCPVCDRPVSEHVGQGTTDAGRAKWAHRRAAAFRTVRLHLHLLHRKLLRGNTI